MKKHAKTRKDWRMIYEVSPFDSKTKNMALEKLMVLTTQTTDWFRERGFVAGVIDDLPDEKKRLYNYQRNSKILLKTLLKT